jgi:hypothetical protein
LLLGSVQWWTQFGNFIAWLNMFKISRRSFAGLLYSGHVFIVNLLTYRRCS